MGDPTSAGLPGTLGPVTPTTTAGRAHRLSARRPYDSEAITEPRSAPRAIGVHLGRRPPATRARRRRAGAVLAGLVAAAVVVSGCTTPSAPGVVRQYGSRTPGTHPAPGPAADLVSGPLRAPGGPYLYDRYGRVVFLHGVNAVYKYPPFELTPAPGQPWNFSASDARTIARLGFNVVRLGITWQGLEPGHGGPNQPGVCTPGTPGNPHMFNAAVAGRYVEALAKTVRLLAEAHVYTLLDMHQDVYNQAFRGEGAPAWAVCTGSNPVVALPGRWSANYRNAALDTAMAHFWNNDVVGNLQGQFDQAWAVVARYFRDDPWVVGYDVFNEPFEREVVAYDALHFAGLLQCFYTGRADPGTLADTTDPLSCPPNDPRRGAVPTIESASPGHLVFIEPDIYSSRNHPSLLGPMDFSNLVLEFHSYCPFRSPVTGDPTNLAACVAHVDGTVDRRRNELPLLSTPRQPGGPAWLMGEFGATQSSALLEQTTSNADLEQLGWIYWAWKYYDDPTGSSDEALAAPDGRPGPTAAVLAQVYPEAVAGRPVSFSFDPETARFQLVYVPSNRVRAPTVIAVPRAGHYPSGFCTTVEGGRIISAPGADELLVANERSAALVTVTLDPGRCPGHGGALIPPTTTTPPATTPPTTTPPATTPTTAGTPPATTTPPTTVVPVTPTTVEPTSTTATTQPPGTAQG